MKNSTKILIGLLIIVVIGIIGFSAGPKKETKTIRIGVLAPLSGVGASLGGCMQEGVEMAQAEINAAGGINGKQVELVIEDDQCNAKVGLTAYQKLQASGINYFVGPLCGVVRVPVLAAAEHNKTLLMTTGLALVTTPETKSYTYNVLPTAWDVAQRITEFGASRGYKRISVLYADDDYGKENQLAIEEYASAHNITIPTEEKYTKGATDLRTQILKLKSDASDAVLVAAYGPDYAVFLKQAKELGLTKQILGVSSIQVPDAAKMDKETGQTVYYSYPAVSNSPSVVAFGEQYRKIKPAAGAFLPMYIGSGHDALTLLAQALKSCTNEDVACVNTALSNTQNYNGANGLISFGARGNNTAGSSIEIRVLQQGEFKRNHSTRIQN